MPRICEAIRRAVEQSGMSQAAVAERLGVVQPTVHGWCTAREPSLDDIARIEEVLGVDRGFLLRAAGYVAEVEGVEGAIRNDPALASGFRDLLLTTYRAAVQGSAEESSASHKRRTRRN